MLLFAAGAVLSLLICLIFALLWYAYFRKRGCRGFGSFANGIGFGLLPAVAVWKSFEPAMTGSRASETADRLWQPGIAGFIRDPMPSRPEMFLILLGFLVLCLWVILRKEDLPGNGDALGVAATLWGTVTVLTEFLHGADAPYVFGMNVRLPAGLLLMFLWLVLWVRRGMRNRKNTGYAAACVPVFVGCSTVICMIRTGGLMPEEGFLSALAFAAAALIAMKAVICMGRVTRKD